MLNPISRLQRWYVSHCDGDWEHSWGIKIDTLDNPGWSIKINLEETERADKPCKAVAEEISDDDWIFMHKEKEELHVACGPNGLERAIAMACDWLEGKLDDA